LSKGTDMADQPNNLTDETLMAFVRGSLPAEEAARIAREAERRPDLAAEIALIRGIDLALAEEAKAPSPGELGWARLSRAIDAETAARASARRPLWQLAAAAAAAVVLWQGVAVPLISMRGDQPGYEPVSEAPAAGFSASVAFAPAATEGAIRELLLEIDATVTGGPSALGLWRLGFETGEARDAGLAALQASGLVESAQAE
jgi:anti-sigma factor RsiW